MELEGAGLIENNPLFINQNTLDFSYQDDSPCIDAGDPTDSVDPDGSTRDIGAYWYGIETQSGDCNADGIQNVLDVVYLINDCILGESNHCNCGDLNEVGLVNVLDVVLLSNFILEA